MPHRKQLIRDYWNGVIVVEEKDDSPGILELFGSDCDGVRSAESIGKLHYHVLFVCFFFVFFCFYYMFCILFRKYLSIIISEYVSTLYLDGATVV